MHCIAAPGSKSHLRRNDPQRPATRTPRLRSIADHHQPVRARLSAPRLARPAEHLAHVRALLVAREALVGSRSSDRSAGWRWPSNRSPTPDPCRRHRSSRCRTCSAAWDRWSRSSPRDRSGRSRRHARSSPTVCPWSPTRCGAGPRPCAVDRRQWLRQRRYRRGQYDRPRARRTRCPLCGVKVMP